LDKLEFRLAFVLFHLFGHDLRSKDFGGLGHHLGSNFVPLLFRFSGGLKSEKMLGQAFLGDRIDEFLPKSHLEFAVGERVLGDLRGTVQVSDQDRFGSDNRNHAAGFESFPSGYRLTSMCPFRIKGAKLLGEPPHVADSEEPA
jgi:hypothetical protein